MKRALLLLLVLGCAHALPVGAPFPPLQVRTLDGAPVNLRDLRGPALVDLWATWCVPCAHALPFYQRLAKETGIEVIAWLLRHPVSFRILRDPDGAVAEELGMRLMPTSFLVDARGMVRARHDGFRDEDEPAVEAEVRSLVAGR